MDANLIPQFGGLLWTIVAFVAALSIIVAIHEYGHYIVGRWCGIKADVFSIGFGPILFSREDRHGTRWQFAALPLGGYVKFRGDANAASVGADDTTLSMSEAERRQTMTGAPLWRRAATVIAGPAFNFILSIAIFGAFAVFAGRAVEAPVVGEIVVLPPGVETLAPGDEVLDVAGRPVAGLLELTEVAAALPDAETVAYRIRRDGAILDVDAAFPMPARAESVMPDSAAWDVGMRPGDVVTAVDGEPIHSFGALRERVADGEGRPVGVDVWRPTEGGGGETFVLTLTPRALDLPLPQGGFERRWLIGINGGLFFEPATEAAGPLEALGYGVRQTVDIISTSLSALGHIVVGQISTCNLSGPVGIAQTAGAVATLGPEQFIWFIAVLSAAVGMLNLFPIPVLDGGHLVFHAYEAMRGRPPSDGAVRVLMTMGVALMGALMVFALWNDFTC